MALDILSLETLAKVDDGSLKIAIDQELRRLYSDILDREGLTKPRKLTLEITLTPKTDQRGTLVDVITGFSVASTLPKKSTEVRMLPSSDGLKFRPTNSENPSQPTLEFGEESGDSEEE